MKSPNDSGIGLYTETGAPSASMLKDISGGGLPRRLNITSDYESNDSPSSSDYSDHVGSTSDERRCIPTQAVAPTQLDTSTTPQEATTPVPTPSSTLESIHAIDVSIEMWKLVANYLLHISRGM